MQIISLSPSYDLDPGLPNIGWVDSGVTENIAIWAPEITVILLRETFLHIEVTQGKFEALAVFI